jgi:hypothetical protein
MQLSDMPREKNILQILPQIFFFFIIKTWNMEMISYAMQDQT